MGERLVIDIQRNNKSIATAYYHWSAYTKPAIHILYEMHKRVLRKANEMFDDQLQLALIRFAEKTTGLGYAETDEEYAELVKEFEARTVCVPDEGKELLKQTLLSHGGIDMSDLQYASERFHGESFVLDGLSRNEGLIAIVEETMMRCKYMAQGIIEVNLDTGQVLNGILYDYDTVGYLEETEEDECALHPHDLPLSPIDIAKFQLEETEIVKDVVELNDCGWIKYDDVIYQFIEG